MLEILVRLVVALAIGLGCTKCVTAAPDDPLRRRADLGASIMPPSNGKAATIVRFRPDSVLEKAGLAVGDQLVAANGQPLTDANAFGAFVRGLRGGDTVKLVARRGNSAFNVEVRALRR